LEFPCQEFEAAPFRPGGSHVTTYRPSPRLFEPSSPGDWIGIRVLCWVLLARFDKLPGFNWTIWAAADRWPSTSPDDRERLLYPLTCAIFGPFVGVRRSRRGRLLGAGINPLMAFGCLSDGDHRTATAQVGR